MIHIKRETIVEKQKNLFPFYYLFRKKTKKMEQKQGYWGPVTSSIDWYYKKKNIP
jgi:hypothetical protein